MIQGADLYSILMAYANKNNSPYIEIDPFLDYLIKYAKKYSKDYPVWNKWLNDTSVKFWTEMSGLIEGNKAEVLADSESGRIFMSTFYPEKLKEVYSLADEKADMPFPSEESLKFSLPEEQVKAVNSEYDLLSIIDDPKKASAPILRLIFPEGFGTALVLPGMIPRQLAEISMLKIRNYLRRHGNKEYAFHKLVALMQGKESYLKDQLEQIILRPIDSYRVIEDSRELTTNFWAHFCSLSKSDVKKKKDRLAVDIAAYQAIHIIEVINGYYKSVALKTREIELAFKNLESCLAKPPYLFTMGQVIKFTGPNDSPLLSIYSSEQLEEWLKRKSSESNDNELPGLLVFKIGNKNELYFLLKDKMFPLIARMLTDARILVRSKINNLWSKLIYDYKSEPSMEDDDEFEKLLLKTAEKICPDLMCLLADPKFVAVYYEMSQKEGGIPPGTKVLNNGKLLPYSAVFNVKRKDLLADARLAMPFWYSLPLISNLIGFFTRLFKEKKAAKKVQEEGIETGNDLLEEKSHASDIRNVAEEIEMDLVPPGYNLDSYLEELEDRWSRLIDKVARETLINDVKFLVKDKLRRTLKINKQFIPTKEILEQMADGLVMHNQALSSLSARGALILYMKLYMIRLLGNVR
jgi:hypothetical protein